MVSNYLNGIQLSFPILAAEVTKVFAFFLKHKKVKTNTKTRGKTRDSQISHVIEEVESIEGVLSKHATDLKHLLKTTSNTPCDFEDTNETIS